MVNRVVIFILIGVLVAGSGLLVFYLWNTAPSPVALGHQEPAWELLASIQIEDTSDDILPHMIKTFPKPVRDAAEEFVIEGYLIRFVAEPYLQEFMIVPDPPECPFCGGAGYGPYLEVNTRQPLDDLPDYTKLSLIGQLEFIEDPTVYDAVKLVDAVLLKEPDL